MNALDWVLLCVGLLCTGRGIWRGAVSQVFGMAGVLGGFVLAAHYYESLALRLAQAFPNLAAAPAISFVTLFFLTWCCVGMAGFVLARLLHHSGLGFLDRFLGAAVGFGKAVLLTMVLVSILTFFLSPQNSLLLESQLVPHAQQIAGVVIQATPDSVQQLFAQKRLELQRHWADYGKAGSTVQTHNEKGAKTQK